MLASGAFTALFGLGYFYNIHSLGFYVVTQVRARSRTASLGPKQSPPLLKEQMADASEGQNSIPPRSRLQQLAWEGLASLVF